MSSRYEVFLEDYHRKIRIEGEVAREMAQTMILPAATEEYELLLRTCAEAKAAGLSAGAAVQKERAQLLGKEIRDCYDACKKLTVALSGKHEEIIEAMTCLRKAVDAMELIMPDKAWPLPKYREMLFVY